jgi:hypothetical protein
MLPKVWLAGVVQERDVDLQPSEVLRRRGSSATHVIGVHTIVETPNEFSSMSNFS